MMLLNKVLNELINKPAECFFGSLIVLVAVSGAIVSSVASTVLALLIILSFSAAKYWPTQWRSLSAAEKILLIGFILYFVSGLIAYLNVDNNYEFIKNLGRYLRFLLFLPIFFYIKKLHIDFSRYLFAGAVLSGPVFLCVAIANNPSLNYWTVTSGQYSTIIFADIALLNVLITLCIQIVINTTWTQKAILFVSIVCGLFAVLLSHGKGAWLALIICLMILIVLSYNKYKKNSKYTIFMLLILLIGIPGVSIPILGGNVVQSKVISVADGIHESIVNDNYQSPGAVRLALWDIAIDIWKEHPVIGTGPGDFKADQIRIQSEKNKYINMKPFDTAHNIFLNSLAITGVVGFLSIIFALVVLPIRYFLKEAKDSDLIRLSGIMLISSFAVFGLTGDWVYRSPMISIFLIYLAVLTSGLNEKLK